MKNESGITLASLVIYILVFSLVLGLLAGLTNYIYGNLENVDSGSYSSEEFNKFNVNFIKDVKNNSDANISSNDGMIKIILEDGTNYTYVQSESAIYRNKTKIAERILVFEAQKTVLNDKSVIKVKIGTGKNDNQYGKTINYVLKYW